MSGNYEKGIEKIATGTINLVGASIGAMLVDLAAYTPDLDNDLSYSDIPEAARIAEIELSGNSMDGTTFRADDAVFPSVESDAEVTGVVLFLDVEQENQAWLIYLSDNAPEFPITPDGIDITIAWDPGANGIFKL